jgi:hypothetical protein
LSRSLFPSALFALLAPPNRPPSPCVQAKTPPPFKLPSCTLRYKKMHIYSYHLPAPSTAPHTRCSASFLCADSQKKTHQPKGKTTPRSLHTTIYQYKLPSIIYITIQTTTLIHLLKVIFNRDTPPKKCLAPRANRQPRRSSATRGRSIIHA